ncbi:Succinyl-CoA synthetase, alpha subunit [Enterococcus faecalis]|nr:Succinyl-CoA synthetase, alpha subunit [Enterococcus faecalis]
MIGMGTDMNLEVIRNVGLYTPALDHVTTGDLLIVLDLDDQANSRRNFTSKSTSYLRRKRKPLLLK